MSTTSTRPDGIASRVVGVLTRRAELLVIVGLLLFTRLLRDPSVPLGVYGLGIASGAAVALQSIGLVLVYRANRVINFAQVELGILGGAVFLQLVGRRMFMHGVRQVCPPCVPAPDTFGDLARIGSERVDEMIAGIPPSTPLPPDFYDQLPEGIGPDQMALYTADGWLVQANFWLSMLVALAMVVLLSWLVYVAVIRRFERAPRLIVTVLTVGLAQVFTFVTNKVIEWVFGDEAGDEALLLFDPKSSFPFELSLKLPPNITLGTTEIVLVLVAVAVMIGLTLFFARSSVGIVLRGSSENPDRAQTLGVNVTNVNALVWMIAGVLSGLVAILSATGVGVGGGANIVRYAAAAVVGGLVSIPVTALAAVTLGIVDQSIDWSIRSPGLMDGIVLAVIVVVLLVQRQRSTRVDTEETGWRAAREMRPIPHELRDVDVVDRWMRGLRVALVVVALGLPWVLSPAHTNLMTVTLVYGMIAMSLLVLTGWAGQISLGQFAFAAIGGWTTARLGLPFPLSIIVGGLAGTVVALVIGVPALRLRGLHLAVSTLAFAVTVTSILLNPRYLAKGLPETIERPSLLGLRLDDQRTFYYFTLVFLAVTVVAVMGMRRSPIARALIASRDNESVAQAFGINLLRARLGAFAVSGFIAAFAGGIYAYSQYGVSPSNFGSGQSLKMFLMVVIGGLGSITGPLLGALYVGMADVIGQDIDLFAIAASGIGTVVVLLMMPGGLGEVVFGIRDAMLRRVADRYRIEVPSLVADRRRQGERARILPKTRPGGGTVFVPRHYRAEGQWAVDAELEKLEQLEEAGRG